MTREDLIEAIEKAWKVEEKWSMDKATYFEDESELCKAWVRVSMARIDLDIAKEIYKRERINEK